MAVERSELRKFIHDVRSPLAVVCGFAELLAEDGDLLDGEQRRDYAAKVLEAARRVETAIGELDRATREPAPDT